MRNIGLFCLLFLLVLFSWSSVLALSVRTLGMGDAYSPAAKDPSGIFYNPAYLARGDAIRLSFDNINGPIMPSNDISLSIGDTGLAHSQSNIGDTYYLSQGFNMYSFLRLGFGLNLNKEQKDFNVGIDTNITKNITASFSIMNADKKILPKETLLSVGWKTDDEDKSFVITESVENGIKIGYEQQITDKAFCRVGYNIDHPSIGATIPLGLNFDLDLAADFAKTNTSVLFGISMFRNTENKRVNSNHSINFGKAIEGEDKFINIEGFNIHYVDSGSGEPLVLIGGGIHYTHHWDPYVKELSKHFRVINIDQLGAGESDKPNYFFGYTIEEQGELIHELLQRIGVKKPNLLGYCYGGSIAFYLAGKYPKNYGKLVAIEGFIKGVNDVPISGDPRLRAEAVRMKHDIEYLNAFVLKDYLTMNYRLLYPYYTSKMWYQVNRNVLYIDLTPVAANINAPVLYYAGTKSWANDFLIPTKEFVKKNMKNSQFIEVPGAGHDVDRYDEREFLDRVVLFLTAK